MRNFGSGVCFFLGLAITSLFFISSPRGAAGLDSPIPRKKVRFDQGYDYRAEEVLENLDFSENKEVPKDFFKGKKLRHCILAGLDLRNSGIEQAKDLMWVDFTGAKGLPNQVFAEKNIQGAKLKGLDLRNSGIEHAENLMEVDFTEAKGLPDQAFAGKNLLGAKLTGLDLHNSGIERATGLDGTDFTGAKGLPDQAFAEKNLWGAKLKGLDLRNSGIEHATKLTNVDFTDATIPLDFLKTDLNSPLFKNLTSAMKVKKINFDGTKMSMSALLTLIKLQSELTAELEKKLKEGHAAPTNPCANQPDILQKAALPQELLLKIAGSNTPKDLRAFALSSKQFNQMTNTPALWKKYLEVFAPDLWKKEKPTQGVSPKELEQRRAQIDFQRATELKILQQLIKKHRMFDHPYFQQAIDRTSSSE